MIRFPGQVVVRLLRMGSDYGGALSVVGRRHRDGSTGCPACDATAFEPVRFERWVRCVGCRTVFVQRPPKSLGAALGEMRSGGDRPSKGDPRSGVPRG